MQTDRIAFVGLDGLAAAMAARLLERGFAVDVHAPRQRLDALVSAGARATRLPADAAEEADIVVLAASGAEAREFLFDHGGLTETLRTGGCVLDMSGVPLTESRHVSQRLARYGLARLELMPLGTSGDAASGELLLLLGGAAEDLAAVLATLTVLGTTWHVGPVGAVPVLTSILPDASQPGGVQRGPQVDLPLQADVAALPRPGATARG